MFSTPFQRCVERSTTFQPNFDQISTIFQHVLKVQPIFNSNVCWKVVELNFNVYSTLKYGWAFNSVYVTRWKQVEKWLSWTFNVDSTVFQRWKLSCACWDMFRHFKWVSGMSGSRVMIKIGKWRSFWTPSWILENPQGGFLGTFSRWFYTYSWTYPEKISLFRKNFDLLAKILGLVVHFPKGIGLKSFPFETRVILCIKSGTRDFI